MCVCVFVSVFLKLVDIMQTICLSSFGNDYFFLKSSRDCLV